MFKGGEVMGLRNWKLACMAALALSVPAAIAAGPDGSQAGQPLSKGPLPLSPMYRPQVPNEAGSAVTGDKPEKPNISEQKAAVQVKPPESPKISEQKVGSGVKPVRKPPKPGAPPKKQPGAKKAPATVKSPAPAPSKGPSPLTPKERR